MVHWIEIISHLGGGKMSNPFDDNFFGWWERQTPFIEDYPYVGINFTNDPNVIILIGDELQDIGNLSFFVI
jgi:hypothetical protein